MPVVDDISPIEYGEDRIALSLSEDTPNPQAFDAVLVNVDYSQALPEGVVLPLELTITSASGSAVYQRRVFKRFQPTQVSFSPREGGTHLVRLAEQHHNRWFGSLVLDVEGEALLQEIS